MNSNLYTPSVGDLVYAKEVDDEYSELGIITALNSTVVGYYEEVAPVIIEWFGLCRGKGPFSYTEHKVRVFRKDYLMMEKKFSKVKHA